MIPPHILTSIKVQQTIYGVLQCHKVSTSWVPRKLTSEPKQRRTDASQELFQRVAADGDGFLSRVVTGKETLVRYHEPETKRMGRELRHLSSLKPNKFCTQPSAGNVMLTLFWNEQCVILEHYMPKVSTVTWATYTDFLLTPIRLAIKYKRRRFSRKGVFWQHQMLDPILLLQRLQP